MIRDYSYLEKKEKKFFEAYDKKIADLNEKYKGKFSYILDFLYEPDCNGKMSVKACKAIWEIIKDYDDNILYGYVGRPDCAKFKGFKVIVKDCIESKCPMKWY